MTTSRGVNGVRFVPQTSELKPIEPDPRAGYIKTFHNFSQSDVDGLIIGRGRPYSSAAVPYRGRVAAR